MAYSMKKPVASELASETDEPLPRPLSAVSRQRRLAAVRALGLLALPVADVVTLNREATVDPKKLLP